MSFLKIMFVFGVLAASLILNVRAVSLEEKQKFHAATSPNIAVCSAEFGLTMDDLKKMEVSDTYDTLDPCIMACVFRKRDMINEQGLFDADKAKEFIKKYLSDEEDQNKAIKMISNCETVNEREVTDGAKGCDRARLLFQCFRPLKAMFAI